MFLLAPSSLTSKHYISTMLNAFSTLKFTHTFQMLSVQLSYKIYIYTSPHIVPLKIYTHLLTHNSSKYIFNELSFWMLNTLFKCVLKSHWERLTLSKFQSLHALKNSYSSFSFTVINSLLKSYISTFPISFHCSKYQRKKYKPFQSKWVSFLLSFIRSSTSRLYKWQYFENVNSYQYLEVEKISHRKYITSNQFEYMKGYLDLDFHINTNFYHYKRQHIFFFIKLPLTEYSLANHSLGFLYW